jgi:hypothetical protein
MAVSAHRRVPPLCCGAVAVAGGVLAYVAGWCRMRLSGADFAVCVALLLGVLALLLLPDGVARERFDNMVSITADVLAPRLDRLVVAMSGRDATKAPRQRSVRIDAEWFAGAAVPEAARLPAAEVPAMQLAYKRIAALLCRASEAAPDRYAELMRALRAPEPEFETAADAFEAEVAAATTPAAFEAKIAAADAAAAADPAVAQHAAVMAERKQRANDRRAAAAQQEPRAADRMP